ncbi:unnamed protein product [Clonostachys rosea]|uniref:non-specific serine/threonine protein kinase n=1 Tax=Bionectria ochroleuca TaxID=29856 RepID=A0ABY6UJN6_BIOOC|nr:unnamed protein product [Clonostachys rosea]
MAGFSQLAGLPEIVRDSQLPATFRWEGQQQFTIHTQGASRRAKQSQEVWAHMGTLGQGGFGSVELQAKQSKRTGQTKQLRAVKSIRIPEDELNENREFYVRELEAIVKFSQARVSVAFPTATFDPPTLMLILKYGELFVKSYGWFACQSVLYIAMEYCELGDLQKYLFKKCQDRRLPENQAHDIASQVLDALTRMHEEKFAHRDLKPANILIKSHPPTHPWVVKVADFGISRRDQGTTMNPTTSVRGTGSFMPPELLGFSGENSRAVDLYAVDMWCYGETLFRMLTGSGTFEKPADLYGYYFGHVKFPRAVLEEIQLSPAVIDFLQSLLTCDPAQRLTSETALDHSWMETDFHGSDASSRRASRLLSSTKPLDGIDPSVLENTIAHMDQTESTGASASWTENFSQLRLEDHQQTTPMQQQTASSSYQHSSIHSSLVSAGTEQTPATSFGGNGPDLPAFNMPSGSSRASTQGDPLMEDTAASLSWTAAFPTSRTSTGEKPLMNTGTAQVQPVHSSFTHPVNPPSQRNHQNSPTHAGQFSEESEATLVPDHLNSQTGSQTIGAFDGDLYPWTRKSDPTSHREDSGLAGISQDSPNRDGISQAKQAEISAQRHDIVDVQRYTEEEMIASLETYAKTFHENKDFKSAKTHFASYWESAKSTLGEEHPVSIHALYCLMDAEASLGEYSIAENLCRRLITLRTRTQGPDHEGTIYSKEALAHYLTKLGLLDDAISWYQDVVISCRRNGLKTFLCGVLYCLVEIYLDKGDARQGELTFQEYIKAKGSILGHTHEQILDDVYEFATNLSRKYAFHGEASRVAQQFFQLTDSLSRSGEPLSRKARSQQQELRLLVAYPQRSPNTSNKNTRPQPSPTYGGAASQHNAPPIQLKPSPAYYPDNPMPNPNEPIRLKPSPAYRPPSPSYEDTNSLSSYYNSTYLGAGGVVEGAGDQTYDQWQQSNTTQPKEKKKRLSKLRGLFS